MILRVGLTGGIASGKSTVARILAGLGCFVIDADDVVRDLYTPGEAGHEALVAHYGGSILDNRGEIDRVALSRIALGDDASASALNGLIHPLVNKRVEEMIEDETVRFPDQDRIVVVEATLLLEAGSRGRYDRVVVVETGVDLQIERAVARGLSREEAQRRIARQMPQPFRRKAADYVIRNDGELASLETQTEELFGKLERDLQERKERGK